jgi:hypothetical protein
MWTGTKISIIICKIEVANTDHADTLTFWCRNCSLVLYVQVTVHRDNLRINNQQDASSIQNFILSRNYMFRALLCPSSGVISCTRGNWYVSYRWYNRCLEDSPRQRPHNLHETYQLPRVHLITPDDGDSRCPKHVDFREKIKFWILDASCWLFIRRCSLVVFHCPVLKHDEIA